MEIAICGLSKRELPRDRELWGMPWDDDWLRMDVLFDLHHPDDVPPKLRERHLDIWQPFYMQDNFYNNATRYPIEDVIRITGDYFTSSVAYMLGFAIHKKIDDIQLCGITAEEDYESQRPCIEYLIGIARGLGAKVEIAGRSKLLTGERYGYK